MPQTSAQVAQFYTHLPLSPLPTTTRPSAFQPSAWLKDEQRFELLSLHVGPVTTEALFYAREDSLVTSRFPGFDRELLRLLPNLLKNVKCYNGHNHHFATEMLATELGHLFEHIWLEVLCCEKIKNASSAHYSGETSWNWKKEPRGLFHITLRAGTADRELIEQAATISKRILNYILTHR
jgi:hypothetical protein